MRLLVVFLLINIYFEVSANSIEKADSLFTSQKYTEAYYIYEYLFESGTYTDRMLLKMAFIQDGSENYPEALYFLNLYYNKTADRSVLQKIAELSEANELNGYRDSDFNYFSIILSKYRSSMQLFLVGFVILFVLFLIKRFQNEDRSIIGLSALVVLAVALAFVNNYRPPDEGIVFNDHTLVMSGPSAASEPVAFIAKGHKVSILNRNTLWTNILWDGQSVFVRTQKVKVI